MTSRLKDDTAYYPSEPPSKRHKKNSAKPVTLSDVFRRTNNNSDNYPPSRQHQRPQRQQPPQRRRLGDGNNFFTLRLEHRTSAKNEERILLFRSDRPGVIGKIVYNPSSSTKDAKIVVLDVKGVYRGRDLGGLLFHEAVTSLKTRFADDDDCRCQLDAEEDLRRYNKLINFYEGLGCMVKPRAKVRFLNNNDGEMYRSVPMQIALRRQSERSFVDHGRLNKFFTGNSTNPDGTNSSTTNTDVKSGSLLGLLGGFLPIEFLKPNGRRVTPLREQFFTDGDSESMPNRRRLDWLIIEDGENGVLFRTTQGHRLISTPDGNLFIIDGNHHWADLLHLHHDWQCFKLSKMPDVEDSDVSDDEDSAALYKQLWLLQTCHGGYLSVNSDTSSLFCAHYPSFWQADGNALSIKCTRDTPPRRQHYRRMWSTQCVQYVQGMRTRYLDFNLKLMTLREALDLAKNIRRHPFRVSNSDSGPNLRTFCFRFADAARADGHPDWIQLVALLSELGRVVRYIDPAFSEIDYDWTITSKSRIVGCLPSSQTNFAEFCHLNPDLNDERYNSTQGMYADSCGFKDMLFTWTGPEYMYHMLRHNDTFIPSEGLDILRYNSLKDWHNESCTNGEEKGPYARFTTEEEENVKDMVLDFDDLRRKVSSSKTANDDLTDTQCDQLWNTFYSELACKYGCDLKLKW